MAPSPAGPTKLAPINSAKRGDNDSPRRRIKLSPPPGKLMIEIAFELGGLAAAVAFGVYAIRAVNDASIANQYGSQAVLVLQALTANQLALLAACLSTGEQAGDIASICSRLIAALLTNLEFLHSNSDFGLLHSSCAPDYHLDSKSLFESLFPERKIEYYLLWSDSRNVCIRGQGEAAEQTTGHLKDASHHEAGNGLRRRYVGPRGLERVAAGFREILFVDSNFNYRVKVRT